MPKVATGKHKKVLTIDTVMILGFEVRTFPLGQEALILTYATGYNNPEGEFIPVERLQKAIQGDEFNAIAAMTPDTTGGLFGALQAILYAEIDKEA